jgi:UDP-glucose 4-epimerase
MKQIIITGHNGFLGSNLLLKLISEKYDITGISKTIKKNDSIKQIKRNILNIKDSDIAKNSCIIHLAAITDVVYCEKYPEECYKVNVMATQKILEIARKKNCSLIYPSTSHVYGIPRKLPIKETHPTNASSVYSESKISGEKLCEMYSKSYGLNISVLRLFSTYGPKNSEYKVESRIITQLLSNRSIKIGNLSPKRDFIYIDDVIRAFQIVIKNLKGFNIYNVGLERSYSIQEICNILKKLSGKKISVVTDKTKLRKNDIKNVVSDCSKIKKLGWKPKISINKGLELTLNWYITRKIEIHN